MKRLHRLALTLFLLSGVTSALALTVEEMQERLKDLPTVKEADLPPLKNEREPFQGVVNHEGLKAHTYVRFPFVENPGSFGFDRKGRLYVVEANRFWQGVPDLRGANELIRDDFKAVAVEDRTALYEKFATRFPEGFFTNAADRIIRLEDRDGNGAADHRTLFSDHFDQPLDGIGFSILVEDDAVYFTCIPNLWKLTDPDDDGVADTHEPIVEGFGARVSFIGHDLHGIIRGPDGRLYFSVGDRGYHVTAEDGTVHSGPGRGAIFRCESDGSGFEVFADGLRNPQELAFDEHGNLFTFDNTGDIGDLARMVYALEGSDSGWNMAHQSARHYVTHLDWESFHPPTSMWVAEKMYAPHTEEQPQWVYPPAANVAEGPSGVTWMTGETLPDDLRGKFILTNYRGPSENCTILTVGIEPKGAGFAAASVEELVKGVGTSDVELGYDGNLYLCDYGGGWSINTNGAIQVLASTDPSHRAAGDRTKAQFAAGFTDTSIEELKTHLFDADNRLRQAAQFELVKQGAAGQTMLREIAFQQDAPITTRLHGIWGLGQIARQHDGEVTEALIELTTDAEPEIRANAARTLGSFRAAGSRDALLALLKDDSPRVTSLAAIALSRVAETGDNEVIDALYDLGSRSAETAVDPVVRHAVLTALDRVGTEASAVAQSEADSREARLLALLFLRRHESPELARFLDDDSPLIRDEAIRAIYETTAVDGPAGDALAALDLTTVKLSDTLQRRVVAANYRRGTIDHARALITIAGSDSVDPGVREAALYALQLWETQIETDSVTGDYRPLATEAPRTMEALGKGVSEELRAFLANDPPKNLASLALNLADQIGVVLEKDTLLASIDNPELEGKLRVAALDSLVQNYPADAPGVLSAHVANKSADLAASAIRHGLALGIDDLLPTARIAVEKGALAPARAGLEVVFAQAPAEALDLWNERETKGLRKELWLDLFLGLQTSEDATAQETAAAFAASAPYAVHGLSVTGGDVANGELVFQNQGACLQCHKIGNVGGIQGPALNNIGQRLSPEKLVESLVNPNAEIAENYGLSSLTLKDGTALAGRIASETDTTMSLIGMDGTSVELARSDVEAITPPISAMPPLGASMPPRELRDLVAYLKAQGSGNGKKAQDASTHGDGETDDEKIAK